MRHDGRRPLLVGNWKMHLTERWSLALLDDLLPRLADLTGALDVAVAPSLPCLRAVADRLRGAAIRLAAQNLHWEDKGPFTGEVSARMLAEIGVELVIVGHSERRNLFGETDERVGKKVVAARRHGIVPILCVGEQESERDEGRTLEVVERQLRLGLSGIAATDGSDLAIAYEPVWAIGTGRFASVAQIQEVHRMIREQLASLYGTRSAASVRILYGGSATPESAPDIVALEDVDGALVGQASLEPARFEAICRLGT